MKPWQHFKTITRHRLLVMVNCFRIGLIRQGLTHDLSKYSPTEFWTGAKYYQGIRSPNAAEREKKGYSAAWLQLSPLYHIMIGPAPKAHFFPLLEKRCAP